MAESETAKRAAAISRRNALKAGAAVGIGAAVWSGPQIGMLGSTPAYAVSCSQPWDELGFDCINTSCDCNNAAAAKIINYKPFTVGGATSAGGCSNASTVTIAVAPGYAQCRVHIEIWSTGSNDCVRQIGTLLATATTAGTAGGTVPMPEVLCGSFADNSGIFTRFTFECNRDQTVPCT